MKNKDLEAILQQEIDNIIKSMDEYNSEYRYYGLRFEDKNRAVGDIITDLSKHNPDRTDCRDFPGYGDEDYNDLPSLDGISSWRINNDGLNLWKKSFLYEWNNDDDFSGNVNYAYILGSYDEYTHDDPDDNEIVLKEPVVIFKINLR